ncbi:MAG: ATP-binding cassette domain-containing protein [Nitriliruptorales bacterium]|nr:ATP-binding cassette domain-containing protein [Nitriliruptorales bacterium]
MLATFGRGRRPRHVHALKGVSFTAYAGEAIGVIGSNGSGKSTLMRAIAGLLPISEGVVSARSTPMLLGVGAVLNRGLSGRRNIMLGGLALGLTRDGVLAREKEIIEFAGIKDAIDRPMATYSSGMKARLQFAISAAVQPEILIIDEALSVGDKSFRKKSEQRVRQLREAAGTVFIVSHGMKSIRNTCTRVLWIEDGVLMADGDPDDVIARYNGHDPAERRSRRRAARRRRRRKARRRARQERESAPSG